MNVDGSGDAPTIQAAHDSATAGDTLLIRPGTYNENVVLDRAITLRAQFGPAATVIDGQRLGRVITVQESVGAGTVIEGFTLRNGYNSTVFGGGIWIGASETVIRGNYIEDNFAGVDHDGAGGGVYTSPSTNSCLIEENVIRRNVAVSYGGGIYSEGVDHLIRANVIAENACHVAGGGASIASSEFSHNVVVANHSDSFAGGVSVSHGRLLNNTIAHNRIGNRGRRSASGVLAHGSALLRNNIVVGNASTGFGASLAPGVVCRDPTGVPVTIECNDIWGNDVDEIYCERALISQNISEDPQFCDEDAILGYHISHTSPCAGLPGACGLIGARIPLCVVTTASEVPWSRVKELYK